MFKKCLNTAALISILAGMVLAADKPKDDNPAKPKPKPTAPSLDELKAIVQPMLDNLDLSAEQQAVASGVMSKDAWKTTLEALDLKRGGEIYHSMHKKIPEIMPTIMMPKMMAYNMRRIMKERMARKAGPPTPKEIKAIRSATQKRMRAKLAPVMMSNFEELTARRMEELLVDKKVLVRVLAEEVSNETLTDKQKSKFDKALAEAGYPQELIHGPDPVFTKQVTKMLETVADEAVAELKKADAAREKQGESKK